MAGGSTATHEPGGNGRPGQRKGVGLRTRITLPLLLPVLGLLTLCGILLAEKLATVTAMQRVGALTVLVTDTSALVHEVQRERGLSGGFLGSKGTELREELTAQRSRTDMRLVAFEARLRQFDSALLDRQAPHPQASSHDSSLAGKLSAARDGLAKIGEIRQQINQLAIGAAGSFAYFTAANTRLLDMVGEAAADVEAPDIARSVSVYLSFLQAKELAGQERGVGAAGFAAGRFDPATLRHLNLLGDQQDLYFRIIAAAETPAQAAFMRQTVAGAAVDAVLKMRRIAAEGGLEGRLDGITGVDWFKAATIRIDLLKQVEDGMANDLRSQTASIDHQARTTLYVALAAVVALLAVTAGLSVFMVRAIVRPLGALIGTMQRLAAGETDLAIPNSGRADEIGRMAGAITVFRDQAVDNRRLLAAQDVARAQAEATKHAAMRDMAEKIETETFKALELVSERTAHMVTTADSMSASAMRTGVSAQSAASAAALALSNAQTVASAAEQLSASIQEISAQVNRSTAVVGRAVAAGEETRTTIRQLNDKVAQIGTVAEMIREIAAKTNLLALNATIEAARAGEAGKGFAVVASEVKSLAMQTARSTEDIARHLTEVNAATSASVDAVGRIGDTISEIHAIASSIAAAVEQQGAATAEIAYNVTQTAHAADEMTTRITEVSAEAEQNGDQAGQVRDGAVVLAETVGDLKRTVVRVVRTSTAEVDRRFGHRHQVNLTVRVSVAGQPPLTGHTVDLSEHGARIEGMAIQPVGTHGTLDLQGIALALPFKVGNVSADGFGVFFELDGAAESKFKTAFERLAPWRAA